MKILGVETSCDDTASAVIEEKNILSDIVSSSDTLHEKYGGVVPEIACRAHIECIWPVVQESLRQANVKIEDIDAVAVTYGPGLAGALLVGVSFAKGLCWASKKPLIGINHLEAHLWVCFLTKNPPKIPGIGLVVSGGHTSLVHIKSWKRFELIGSTIDDAAGETFDKVAKILKLGYPGGPKLQEAAKNGKKDAIKFPIAKLEKKYNFSFSGLKTSVLYYAKNTVKKHISDIAASFQEAVVGAIVKKTIDAVKQDSVQSLVCGGGVVSNERLRKCLEQETKKIGIPIYFPDVSLCRDNAVMIAALGMEYFKQGRFSSMDLTAVPDLGIGKGN
ncbi:tRNA (adenosine(37)-N6)-threonylcarbamoyltransferase complex transferase subunit TsaD [bacterium Unc6]|nr:tRNA (adenosine(37)-N6)-threonylcarbamoyltransferase complex transferase subunit TsaD [bacterium Unc6]